MPTKAKKAARMKKVYHFLRLKWGTPLDMSNMLNGGLLLTERVVGMSAMRDEVLVLVEREQEL